MKGMRLLKVSFLVLAAGVMLFAGIANPHYTQTASSLSASTMATLVGGDRSTCVGTFIGLGLGLLASAVVIAATGGAAAPVLAIAGAYVPLASAAC